ncbi:winged helix-turn-helix domain-containing protein [uncultured Methanolobus sp.]|uniref:winged helix-turn-helix domain-containing protein n=1 Tax=uncultured Methanolobus sp. TaxID=218300 RepID=UPI0029C8199B|nr:winged helix-turn-helix domain-containing protein [uncultured Methanolobus sp.]
MSVEDNINDVIESRFLKLFYALDSKTRLKMIQSLHQNEKHISELAREQDISVPVASKHVSILEDASLIERHIYGKTHVLEINNKNVASSLDILAPTKTVKIKKGSCLLDALKEAAIIETKKRNGIEQVIATNGDEGFYIYEMNGELHNQTVQKCILTDDVTIIWKKLEPIAKLRLNVEVED